MSSNDAKGTPVDIVDRGVADAWLKMHETSFMNKSLFPDYDALIPDMNKLAPSFLTDSTMDRMTELAKKMLEVVAPTFMTQNLDPMQKLAAQTTGIERFARQLSDNQAAITKMLDPSLSAFKVMSYDGRFQTSLAAMSSSFATSIDTSRIQDILASASTLMEGLTDEDLEEIDDFFESQPDLAETVEELPVLYTLSKTDRALFILFVRVCVTMAVACIMLNIEAELPEVQRLIDAFVGIGGWAVGKKAGEITGKVLDKLPQAEES
ncbi:hypothetical protein [Paenarthrobacter nicotinovorans]|uniref:hypothetical protein n=1 Tax=Paenarthrobacter nicotinovorans TaxID=29320 RepID=UPI003749103A